MPCRSRNASDCWRQSACVEDIDLRTPRGIDRAVFARLVGGDWIDRNENLLITGATGLGKSWIACALGHKACRDNRSVQYHRVPRLFEALALARGAFNSSSSTTGGCRFSIRPNGATFWSSLMIAMVAPQPSSPAKSPWNIARHHSDPTLGDAILDRLVHNAHRLQLTGESMRKKNARNQTLDAAPNA